MATRTCMHKRSRSDPIPRKHDKNRANETDDFHLSHVLHREIERLKCLVKSRKTQSSKPLSDELLEEEVMEKVIRRGLFLEGSRNEGSIAKDAKKLVREITVLELQVMYLERYLLSLYRRVFNRRIFSRLAVDDEPPESEAAVEVNESEKGNLGFLGSKPAAVSPENLVFGSQKVLEDSGIFRSHSSLSHRSGCSFRMSPQAKDLFHHSLPFSMLEQADIDAVIGADPENVSENVPTSPNRLSEEMIRSISSVLNQLAHPNPLDKRQSYSPFRGRERAKFGFPDGNVSMVKSIHRDTEKLTEVEPELKHYRSLVHQLERVNPAKLNHEEKLAFWINIHNSLAMHAVLVYGAPKSNMKRVSLMLKASYDVGGRSLNLDTIQTSILHCRVSRPGQRLRFLFPSKPKGKAGDARNDYAISHSEPLLHFALCSGNISDPPVRIYAPGNMMQELEAAKEEYIRSNISITKDNKILLPKLVETYSKDSDLCHVGIIEMIENSLPCEARNKLRDCRDKKSRKLNIEWVSHDFGFGLLLPQEIA